MQKFYLYILLCSDNSLYTGITNDVDSRLNTHREGKGSKYVRAHLPFTHIYTEEFEDKVDAMKREWEIKHWHREKKIRELGLIL